jgi:hypothetical protein
MALGDHEFLNAFINDSATIVEKAGADLPAPAHKAVAYNASGDVILAAAGDTAIGVILSDSLDPIEQGQPVHILIKHIGLLQTGVALIKGDPITIAAGGIGAKAASGQFIFGWALSNAAPGECVQVQITRSGYKS